MSWKTNRNTFYSYQYLKLIRPLDWNILFPFRYTFFIIGHPWHSDWREIGLPLCLVRLAYRWIIRLIDIIDWTSNNISLHASNSKMILYQKVISRSLHYSSTHTQERSYLTIRKLIDYFTDLHPQKTTFWKQKNTL